MVDKKILKKLALILTCLTRGDKLDKAKARAKDGSKFLQLSMAMEIEIEGHSNLILEKDRKALFGRGNGFSTNERTVSRRHVLFEFKHKSANQTEPSVSFEVLGKNPIWVRSQKDGGVRVFRRSEKGEVAAGDWFCLSGKRPFWFRMRNVEMEEREKRVLQSESELAEGLQSGSELEGLDVSGIDPVKEFGFVVMGHEFDPYPKQMIRDVKKWNWFLEEPRKESDNDDEFEQKERKGVPTKRKKGKENEDEEWTEESEADEELVAKFRKVNKPKYSTRSKAGFKPQKDTKWGSKSCVPKKTSSSGEEKGIENEDEGDETLGGFIVGEEDLEEEELEETDKDEEEEEFVEDEE